jgi:hypothetical protein|tara:strand:+ start:572 stop:760 length:189 start_codon:yes stop_codon:yes gene_type:complete
MPVVSVTKSESVELAEGSTVTLMDICKGKATFFVTCPADIKLFDREGKIKRHYKKKGLTKQE